MPTGFAYSVTLAPPPGANRGVIPNKWSHVVAVWNGSQAKLYVDGAVDQNPALTFAGVLSQAPDLVSWSVLPVTSLFTVPSVERPGKIFFRAGR